MKHVYFHSRSVRWVLCGLACLGLSVDCLAVTGTVSLENRSGRTVCGQIRYPGGEWGRLQYLGNSYIPPDKTGVITYSTYTLGVVYSLRVYTNSMTVSGGYVELGSWTCSGTFDFPFLWDPDPYNPRTNNCVDVTVTNGSSDSQFVEIAHIPTNVVSGLSGGAATAAAAAFVAANPSQLKRLVLGVSKVFRITPQSLAFNAAIAAGVYVSTRFFDSLGVQNVTQEGYVPLTAPTSDAECWTMAPMVLSPTPKTDSQKLAEAVRAPQTDGTNIVDESPAWSTNYMGVLERILQQEKDGPTNRPSQSATEQANSQGQAGRDAIESTRSGVAGLANTGGGGGGPIGPLGVTVPDSNPDFWKQTITLAPVGGASAGPSFELSWNPLGGPMTTQIQAIVNALMRYGSWLAMVAFCWKITINHARDAYSVKEAGSAAAIPVISTGLAQACALVMTVAIAAIPAFFVSWLAGSGSTYSTTFQGAITGAGSTMLNEAVNLLWHTVPVAVVLVHLGIAYVYKLNVWLLYIVCGGVVKFCTG